MAKAPDVKKSLLDSLTKLEAVRATVNEMDPGNHMLDYALKLVRALCAALISAMYHLQQSVVALSEAEPVQAQLKIDDLLRKVRRQTGSLDPAHAEAISDVVAEAEREDDADGAPADPQTVLELLLRVQQDRAWAIEEVASWSAEDLAAAAAYCRAVLDGDDMPEPTRVGRTFLEELEPETSRGDANKLLVLLEIYAPKDGADWSDDLWDETIGWAIAFYRARRGEEVEVPDLPAHIMPTVEMALDLKAVIADAEDGLDEVDLVPEGPVGIAVAALEHLGEIKRDGFLLRGEDPNLNAPSDAFVAAAQLVGRAGQRPDLTEAPADPEPSAEEIAEAEAALAEKPDPKNAPKKGAEEPVAEPA